MEVTKWRGLDRALFQKLVEGGDWIDAHEHRPSATRPAATIGQFSTRVSRGYSRSWRSRAATAVMPDFARSLGRAD